MKYGVRILPREKGGTDFGSGFYLTSNFKQASDWAKRRAKRPIINKQALDLTDKSITDFLRIKVDFKPVVIKFKIKDFINWEKLNYKVFNDDGFDWKRFVWNMRHAKDDSTPLRDWIYGPVADGGLQSEHFLDIRAYNDKNQLAVLTQTAAEYLELLEVIS